MKQRNGQKNPNFESHNCVRCAKRIEPGQGYMVDAQSAECTECDAEASWERLLEQHRQARQARQVETGR